MNRLFFSKKLNDFFFHTSSNKQHWRRRLVGKNLYAQNNHDTLVHIRLDNKLTSLNYQPIPDDLEVDLTDINYSIISPLTKTITHPLSAGDRNFFKTKEDIIFDLDDANRVLRGKISFGGDYITTPTLEYNVTNETSIQFDLVNHKPNRYISFYLSKRLAASFYGKNMWRNVGQANLVSGEGKIAITFQENDAGGIESISIPPVEITDANFKLLLQPQRSSLPYMNYDFFCVVSDEWMLYRQLDYPFTDFFFKVNNLYENEEIMKYLKDVWNKKEE